MGRREERLVGQRRSAGGKVGGVGYMERKKLWDEVLRSAAPNHRIVSVKWVDTKKKAPRRIQRNGEGSWPGTFDAPTWTGRTFSRPLRRGS